MKGKTLDPIAYRESVAGLCMICTKPMQGVYGHWGKSGTCSKKCEKIQEIKPVREKYNNPNPVL